MNFQYSQMKTRYMLIIGVFIVLFLFNLSSVVAVDFSTSSLSDEGSTYVLSASSKNPNVKTFDEFYSKIMSNTSLESNAVEMDGKTHEIITLSTASTAIQLPNDILVMQYAEENISILPKGSKVSVYEDSYLVSIPDEDTVLKVSQVLDLPFDTVTKTAAFDQSIDNLDEYKVIINFSELENSSLKKHMRNYSVDWGDGTLTNYDIEQHTVQHIYRKSGTYNLTLQIADGFGLTHSLQRNYKVKYEGNLIHGYLWVKENKEPVAVTTTSVSMLAVGLFALTETGKYKLLALLPLLIPLYTRIQKEDVLDQFVRGQIYGYIKTNPGVHYNQIRRGIDVKNGTLSYHLSVLEKTELIKSRREGLRYRVFYPTGMKFPKKQRFRLTEFQIQILDIIKEYQGITQKDIAGKLGKKPQTINYNIKVLEQADLIEVKKKGRKTKCFIKEPSEPVGNVAE